MVLNVLCTQLKTCGTSVTILAHTLLLTEGLWFITGNSRGPERFKEEGGL